jgi:hypothetical protein
VFFFLPEVKGRTLEEIDEMFEARLPARKFGKYVCIGMAQFDENARKDIEHEKEIMVLKSEKVTAETTVTTTA